ncbi:hypothetical protein TrVE_jg8215 [Triparma verrucosa]|uniref:Uncharacterized protein n=1 Tax=Triparma verrucosa TaxID=1606542 RepID=A0A9W7CCA0_9STRA|nr:hypothetical protein TrVE_jg8215 [Triparma verrucosa]
MSALVSAPTSNETFVSALITRLNLDAEIYSPYLLPSLSTLVSENVDPSPTPSTPSTYEAIKAKVSTSSSVDDLVSVLELLHESSGEEDDKLVETLMKECVEHITLHVVFLSEEELKLKTAKEEKEREELSRELERAKLEKETTSQEQLKEEDPEERRRKEELLARFGYEDDLDPAAASVADDADSTSKNSGGKNQKQQQQQQQGPNKIEARREQKQHEQEKKKKKEDRRKKAVKGERKR